MGINLDTAVKTKLNIQFSELPCMYAVQSVYIDFLKLVLYNLCSQIAYFDIGYSNT